MLCNCRGVRHTDADAGSADNASAHGGLQRRRFLQGLLGAGAGLTAAGSLLTTSSALAADHDRKLSLYAPATGETIRLVYWAPGEGYIEQSLQEISHVMRDRRNGEVKRIDPKLLDAIYTLQLQLQPREPVHMLSGYRSPQTNEMLRRRNRGVARNSLHMRGMAVDIRMPDRKFTHLHKAALELQAGGVGRYRRSGFIHLDTGAVRRWG